MEIKTIKGGLERRILTGMIVDDAVCGAIATKWPARDGAEHGPFQSRWANLVAKWCKGFYEQYERAPRASIQGMFESWASNSRDTETVRLVERFLGGLSADYAQLKQDINSHYLIDRASEYFNRVKLTRLAETIQGDIDAGEVSKAAKRVADFSPVEMGTGAGVAVFQDKAAIKRAFAQTSESIIALPGAMGEFFGRSLRRGAFVSFVAPEKKGKTWVLTDLAYRAATQRLRTAFIAVGDEGEADMMLRFAVRATRHPQFPCEVRWPIEINKDAQEVADRVRRRKMVFEQGLTARAVWEAFQLVQRRHIHSDEEFLRLACFPSDSLSLRGLRDLLKQWARDGFVLDVLVLDYPDNMLLEGAGNDFRQQTNMLWKGLRGISQEWLLLLLTVTQANAAADEAELIGRSMVSEDKRKKAHVTAMLGITQSDAEEDYELRRFNWIVRRGERSTRRRVLHAAGCLDLGAPFARTCI